MKNVQAKIVMEIKSQNDIERMNEWMNQRY